MVPSVLLKSTGTHIRNQRRNSLNSLRMAVSTSRNRPCRFSGLLRAIKMQSKTNIRTVAIPPENNSAICTSQPRKCTRNAEIAAKASAVRMEVQCIKTFRNWRRKYGWKLYECPSFSPSLVLSCCLQASRMAGFTNDSPMRFRAPRSTFWLG